MKRTLITRYRVITSLFLAAAAAAIFVGFQESVDRVPQDTLRDQRVVTVEPAADGSALRQSRIFAQLADNYTGVLVIDGREIPEDQLDRREGLNTVGFTPGPGLEIDELNPGERCAIVVYWPSSATREASSNSYRWCWQVH